MGLLLVGKKVLYLNLNVVMIRFIFGILFQTYLIRQQKLIYQMKIGLMKIYKIGNSKGACHQCDTPVKKEKNIPPERVLGLAHSRFLPH